MGIHLKTDAHRNGNGCLSNLKQLPVCTKSSASKLHKTQKIAKSAKTAGDLF